MAEIIDTHAIIKSITESGIEEKSAEAIVKAIIDTKIHDMNIVATKVDLEKIQKDMADVKSNLLKWYISTTLAAIGVVGTVATVYVTYIAG